MAEVDKVDTLTVRGKLRGERRGAANVPNVRTDERGFAGWEKPALLPVRTNYEAQIWFFSLALLAWLTYLV